MALVEPMEDRWGEHMCECQVSSDGRRCDGVTAACRDLGAWPPGPEFRAADMSHGVAVHQTGMPAVEDGLKGVSPSHSGLWGLAPPSV